jgi:hypothetical protein
MPTMTVGFVERVLITLPQAQRISASTYFGCMSVFIKMDSQNTMNLRDDKQDFWVFQAFVVRTFVCSPIISGFLAMAGLQDTGIISMSHMK